MCIVYLNQLPHPAHDPRVMHHARAESYELVGVVCVGLVVCRHQHPTPGIPIYMSLTLVPPWQPMYRKSL